jgi:hypothetical protein
VLLFISGMLVRFWVDLVLVVVIGVSGAAVGSKIAP